MHMGSRSSICKERQSVGCKYKQADLALLIDDRLIFYISRANGKTTDY